MRAFLPVLIAVIASSSVAFAGPAPGSATLAAPAAQARVVGEAGVWQCNGATCTGPADTRPRLAVAACTAVAKVNGRVAAFTAEATSFGPAELDRCNRHVKSQ